MSDLSWHAGRCLATEQRFRCAVRADAETAVTGARTASEVRRTHARAAATGAVSDVSVTRAIVQPFALARAFERQYRASNQLEELSVRWHEALHCLRTLAIVDVGATLPGGSRMRRTADVWFPVASRLERRFAQVTRQW